MNGYQLLIPQLLAAGVILAVCLRTIRRAQLADVAHEADFQRRKAEIIQAGEARRAAMAAATQPSESDDESALVVLRLTLDLSDPDAPELTCSRDELADA